MQSRFSGCAVLSAAALLTAGLPAFAQTPPPATFPLLTRSYNNQRTGVNLSETLLTAANVSVSSFGKLFSLPVDGSVYAQPLYVPNLALPGKGTHNVLFVATMHDSIYAFDADALGAPLWKTSYLTTSDGVNPPPVPTIAIPVADFGSGYHDIANEMGIISTPAIDGATGTMYVVVRTKESGGPNGMYVQRIHALDITTGLDTKPPKVIAGSVTGSGSNVVTFDPYLENQRPGLLLDRGNLYIAWASQGDGGSYHGWIMSYNAANLTQNGIFCTTPRGGQGGIWMSGQGISADSAGSIYAVVGNGDSSKKSGGTGYGNSLLKLVQSGTTLSVLDWFMPYNTDSLNGADLDTACGVALYNTPGGSTYALFGGKDGVFYVADTANLGRYNPNNSGSPQNDYQIVESFQVSQQHIHGTPVVWNGPATLGTCLYLWAENSTLRGYKYQTSTNSFSTSTFSQSTFSAPNGMPGGTLTLSANGSTAGTGLVWVNLPYNANANQAVVSGVLRVFDASDLTKELWNSRTSFARDDFGNYAKYVPPVVMGGKVYMATFSNQVVVYGTLSVPVAPTLAAVPGDTQVTLTWNAVSGASTYTVSRGASAAGPFTPVKSGLSGTNYIDTGLTDFTTYYYVVNAANGAGTSPNSSPVSATPYTNLPDAVTSLTGYAGNAQVALVWNPAARADSYTLYRSTSNGGPYAKVVAAGLTGTGYVDIAVANTGLTYYYVLVSTNTYGSSGYSNQGSGKPAALANGAAVSIYGSLVLEKAVHAAQIITFECRPTDGSAAVTQTQTLSASGAFALTGLPAKSYNVAVKGAKWLRTITPVDASNGTMTGITASLSGGDADNSNVVDIADFGLLVNAYGGDSSVSGSGYDTRADFNCDGIVDIADFGLLVNNYGLTGAP